MRITRAEGLDGGEVSKEINTESVLSRMRRLTLKSKFINHSNFLFVLPKCAKAICPRGLSISILYRRVSLCTLTLKLWMEI